MRLYTLIWLIFCFPSFTSIKKLFLSFNIYLFLAVHACSVMSDSLWPHGLYPTRLLCPWGFSSQEYWIWLLFPPPGESSQPRDQAHISCLLHWQADSLPLAPLAVARRFSSSPRACGILVPWPGIEPESPVLQGRFLTIGQPGNGCLKKKKKQLKNGWPDLALRPVCQLLT